MMQYVWAFVIGGGFCVLGQLLIDFTKLTPARVLVCFVMAGVVLSALDLYDPLAEFAGAMCIMPPATMQAARPRPSAMVLHAPYKPRYGASTSRIK